MSCVVNSVLLRPKILMLLCLLLSQVAEASVQISLRDGVVLMNSTYTLDDVANVSASDPDLIHRLRNIELGDTPRPGQSLTLTQIKVGARLERVLPGTSTRIDWAGKPAVQVRGGGVQHEGSLLADAARQTLVNWLNQQYPQLATEIKLVGDPAPFYTTIGPIELVARLSNATQLRSRMSVWVDVHIDSHLVTTRPMWFAVTAHTQVAVADKDLSRHMEISSAHVVYESRDIASLTTKPVSGIFPLEHRTKRRIAAGDVIVAAALEPIPKVRQGEIITVHAKHRQVALSVQARALTDGNLDESILVESLSSHTAYRATVSGDSQATVE